MAERADGELVEDLLALERRLISVYEAGLRRGVIGRGPGELLLEHEREHARALEEALAGGPRNPRASVPLRGLAEALRSSEGFARFALELEARAVAAYADAAARIGSRRLRQPLGSIMACEAAHGVALRAALGVPLLVD